MRKKSMRTEIITLERLGTGNDAVGHLTNGKTVFVPFGCPGDEVEIEVEYEKEHYARGSIIRTIRPSEARVTPPCTYFAQCGGCDWQHIGYERQLEAKRQSVIDALERIGKLSVESALVEACRAPYDEFGYRNKIELAVNDSSSIEMGFTKRSSDELVFNDTCPLFARQFAKVPKALRGALKFALQGKPHGALLRVGIRAATFSSDCEVALYTEPGAFPRALVVKVIREAMPKVTSIVRVLLKGSAAQRKVSKVEVLFGKGGVREKLSGFEYHISAPSFWQVNTRGAQVLVDTVLEFLQVNGTDTAVDLYSGVGTFTLPLAAEAGEVIAVESYGPAVRDLRRSLERNNLDADVIGGDAAREISGIKHIDALVVDPPRSGLDARVIEALLSHRELKKLAYVSCNPATLARDLAKLTAQYTIERVIPVDLFPQTNHVETVVLITRVNK